MLYGNKLNWIEFVTYSVYTADTLLRGRGYNKNCVLYPRTWVDEINFFTVLDVSLTMDLTRCYI